MTDPAFAGKRERDSLLAALELFRELDTPQSTNALALFLYVCENEGVNMSELAYVSRLHVATAARLARALAGEDEALAVRQDQPFPGQEGAAIAVGALALVSTDQARPLGNDQIGRAHV